MSATSSATEKKVASDASQQPFDILTVPFYRAVTLFEKEHYEEAFVAFLECTQKGNLYAAFYLDFLFKKAAIKAKLSPDLCKSTTEALEYFDHIPKEPHHPPDSWLKASLVIIEINQLAPKNKSRVKALLSSLHELGKYAANANIFYIRFFEEKNNKFNIKPNSKELDEIEKQIQQSADLFTLHYFATQTSNSRIKLNSTQEQELSYIRRTYAALIKSHDAPIERFMAGFYNAHTKQKPSSFQPDLSRHFAWLFTAIHMGNKTLQFAHGSITHAKFFELKERGMHWILIAALNNDPQALLLIGQHYYLGSVPSLPQDNVKARIFLQKGTQHFLQNAEQPVTQEALAASLAMLGSLHERGEGGLIADETTALKYYAEAAKRDHAQACERMGNFYTYGAGGLGKNYAEALQYYQRSIAIFEKSKGDSDILVRIASINCHIAFLYYRGGFGLAQDLSIAVTHYKKASALDTEALSSYASMLYNGQGIGSNKELGITLMFEAAEKGSAEAAGNLMTLHFKDNISDPRFQDDHIEKYLLLTKKVTEKAISWLASFYISKRQYAKAHPYLLEGVKLKQSQSMHGLGYLYETGCSELKIKQDYEMAFEHYHNSASLNNTSGMVAKGFLLLHGHGVTQDVQQAKALFEAAREKGNKLASFNLAAMYRHELGVAKDLKKAFDYLKEAEETNDGEVFFTLAICYCNGEGTEANPNTAIEYLLKATYNGHAAAAYNCAVLYINVAFKNKYLTEEHCQLIQQCLSIPCAEGYSRAIFLKIMIDLYQNPNEAGIKIAIEALTAAESKKPYSKSTVTLQLLKRRIEEGKTLSKSEILILIYNTFKSIQEVDALFSQHRINLDEKTVAETMALPTKTSTPISSATPSPIDPTEKLMAQMRSFSKPDNIKSATFEEFRGIVGKVLSLRGISGKMCPSKGGTQVRVNVPDSKSLCFSYHPTHRSGSGPDAAFDPKRSKNLQEFVSDLHEKLTAATPKK